MTPPRGEASRRRRRSDRRRAQHRGARRIADTSLRSLPNWPLLGSALVGISIAGYLATTHWVDSSPAGCEAGSACALVQSSRLASLLGVPLAAWGIALYSALALVAVSVRNAPLHSRLALAVSGAGLGVSLYVTAAAAIELGVVCAWCVASLGTVTACFALARAPALRRTLGREIGIVAAGSVVLVAAVHVYYDESLLRAPRHEAKTLRELALHLRATGARFYGASWCRACIAQKKQFGDAASLLPYVECAPEGPRRPQTPSCRSERIARYPTWVIGRHRHEGLLDVEVLAAWSSFESSESGPSPDPALEEPAATGRIE